MDKTTLSHNLQIYLHFYVSALYLFWDFMSADYLVISVLDFVPPPPLVGWQLWERMFPRGRWEEKGDNHTFEVWSDQPLITKTLLIVILIPRIQPLLIITQISLTLPIPKLPNSQFPNPLSKLAAPVTTEEAECQRHNVQESVPRTSLGTKISYPMDLVIRRALI